MYFQEDNQHPKRCRINQRAHHCEERFLRQGNPAQELVIASPALFAGRGNPGSSHNFWIASPKNSSQ